MSEIYWITRLGSLHILGVVLTWISLLFALVCWLISVSTDDWSGADCCNDRQKKRLRNAAKSALGTLVVGVLMWTFIPTKKEAFFIYGVGGTIDYVKSNPVAKKLPDKCVNALDKWVDSWSIEEKSDTIK